MENNQNTPQRPVITPFWQTTTARLMMVGALTLVLMIPLVLVNNLILERSDRKNKVVSEISDKWGEDVYLYGPIVRIPYTTYEETVSVNQKTKETVTQRIASTEYAYFFPDELRNDSKVTTDKRNYGNYESVVYTSVMDFKGKFASPDFSSRDIKDADIQWEKASIVIKTTNLKSIRDEVKINFGDSALTFEPVFNTSENDTTDALETGYFDARKLQSGDQPFSFRMTYRGSNQLLLVPIGKTTTAHMESNWADPGFTGNFLPSDDKKVTEKGFSANWKILHVNRPFAQQSFGLLPDLARFAFGVKFVIQVDEYQQNYRASNYGFLVIGLTFLTFFLIQTRSKIKIHIFQYTMIGLALILFYSLLISITEHSSFLFAYLVSSVAVIAMISLYSISILKNRRFPMFIAGSLTALYGFIFVIIQLEDYALLFGSVGLFVILGLVMWISRKMEFN